MSPHLWRAEEAYNRARLLKDEIILVDATASSYPLDHRRRTIATTIAYSKSLELFEVLGEFWEWSRTIRVEGSL